MKSFRLPVILILLVLAVGCGEQQTATPPPAPVIVAQPVVRSVQAYQVFTGVTRGVAQADVRARVSGTLEQVAFEPSSLVEKGDLLFVIEQEYYRAMRDEARAFLESARADLALAESELERIEAAIKTKAVSELDLDRAKAQRDRAQASVHSAQAKLDKAELDYGYTEVRAPFAGQVSRNLVDVGNLVGQGESTLLTTVNQMQPLYVYFEAPEPLVLRMLARENKSVVKDASENPREITALVATSADTGFPHVGHIDYIDNTVNPQTGTIQLRAMLPNDDFQLFPGLFVRVKVLGMDLPGSVLVEEAAIGTDLGGKYVLLVGEDGIVEQRYVTLSPIAEDGMIRIEEGLDGSETYVVEGLLKARPGRPVTPLTREQAAARMAQRQGQGG